MEATVEIVSGSKTHTRTTLLFFAPTIFLSAFLLFVCEPMVGKMMLPLLGGAASVWITCLLFFQLMLLLGYGYAHVLERLAGVQTQMLVHAVEKSKIWPQGDGDPGEGIRQRASSNR